MPINKLPPEILAHIASFFERERDLTKATAVCQQWRVTLISFPRLWCNAGGSQPEMQEYIKRSKSAPLNVNLFYPGLVGLIVPHTFRLASLDVVLHRLLDINQVVNCLHSPIPTLHTFGISTTPSDLANTVTFPSGLHHPFFLHSKKLKINRISEFLEFPVFPCVTELTWSMTGSYGKLEMASLLRTLEQLPLLERVYLTFGAGIFQFTFGGDAVTLSRVQEMKISGCVFPNILRNLRLPKLTVFCVEPRSWPHWGFPSVFPVETFEEQLPNFVELPEVHLDMGSREITFRNPQVQVTLKCSLDPLEHYYNTKVMGWGGLPLHSVRRLVVDIVPGEMIYPRFGQTWLIYLPGDLKHLEYLELRGEGNDEVRRVCDSVMRENESIRTKILNLRWEEHDKQERRGGERVGKSKVIRMPMRMVSRAVGWTK